jgi:hypothetical protein
MNDEPTAPTGRPAQFYCPVTDKTVEEICWQVCIRTLQMLWWNCPFCCGWHVASKNKKGGGKNEAEAIYCEECHLNLRTNLTNKK